MAKKGNRQIFGLTCADCKTRNYMSSKSTVNTKEKLSFNKFCKHCRKVTTHAETSKLD